MYPVKFDMRFCYLISNKMSHLYNIKSLIFYPDYYDDKNQAISDQIIIPSHTLNRLMDYFDENDSIFLMKLINTNTKQDVIVSIGTPHYYEKDTIYAPQWILDMIGCSGNCDTPVCLKRVIQDIPLATSVVIKPLDSMMFHVDLVDCFQKVLQNVSVLQEGSTIPVIIPELGNYECLAYIEKVEPEKISRAHSGDLAVDFQREFEEHTPSFSLPTSSIPTSAINTSNLQFTNSMCNQLSASDSLNNDIHITPSKDDSICQAIEDILTPEERRKRIRDSWVNRFTLNQNSV